MIRVALKERISLLKENIMLVLSSFSFMGLNARYNINGIISIAVSFLFIVLFFSKLSGVFMRIKRTSILIKIYSAVTTVGICYFSRQLFISNVSSCAQIDNWRKESNLIDYAFSYIIPNALALVSCLAVFAGVLILIEYLYQRLKPLFVSLSKKEIIIYSFIVVLFFLFSGFVFKNSDAFWYTYTWGDIIYTSDSSMLVENNVYMDLYSFANELRQPLFAVFAAPFVGFGYTLSLPLSSIHRVIAPFFINCVQIVLLFVANLMLAKMIVTKSYNRICFMIISSVLYPTLLFSVMMEQYIVAYFWLIFVLYEYHEYKKVSFLSYAAAGGTLLTSLITVLPLSQKIDHRLTFKAYMKNALRLVGGFFAILFAFGRFDILLDFSGGLYRVAKYTGRVSAIGKINQFTNFVYSCFFAPEAVIDEKKFSHYSWQLNNDSSIYINTAGIIIFVICIISFFINRNKILTRLAGFWMLFSFILLCFFGWGAEENGMVLYTLYFGWAFLVLLFQLISWISEKTSYKSVIPITGGLLIIVLCIINYHGIKEMLDFAFEYWPV